MGLEQRALLVGQAPASLDQVRAPLKGAMDRHRMAPLGDAGVVTGPQDLGNLIAPEVRRTRVLGVLEQPGRERLLVGGGLVAEHPRQQAGDSLHDDECRQFPAGQDQVADRELLVTEFVPNPLVDALVAPAEQREAVPGRQLMGDPLVEPATGGVEQDQRTGRFGRLDRCEDRIGHQHHARPAAERTVVDRPMNVGGGSTQVACVDLEEAGVRCPTQDAPSDVVADHLRKDREDVDAHGQAPDPSSGSSSSPLGTSTATRTPGW